MMKQKHQQKNKTTKKMTNTKSKQNQQKKNIKLGGTTKQTKKK